MSKKEVSQEKLLKIVLEKPLFIPIPSNEFFERVHDDHDGSFKGKIAVAIVEGDMWVRTEEHGRKFLRFRDYFGGGQSLRVHNALKLLALAIKLDNEDFPLFPS